MIPENLIETTELVFDICGFRLGNLKLEKESLAYSACQFELDGTSVLFRLAKITPTKIGQFVTFWKRSKKGTTAPYEVADAIDFFIINAKNKNEFGQFIFPQLVLAEKGIISTHLQEGKRGMRVYPPWDIPSSKQAQKTQQWQLPYFLEIPINQPLDLEKAKNLYRLKAY